jgi:hypothetical protein
MDLIGVSAAVVAIIESECVRGRKRKEKKS